MTELEKVEKLREKADVSFAEAKEALDNSGGDILDALIYLEKQGKAIVPAGGGYFSGADSQQYEWQQDPGSDAGAKSRGESFSEMMKRFGRFCIKVLNIGNTNFLDASKNGSLMFSCPITALILLLIFFFWVTVPLFVVSLFFGFRYSIRGKDLGRDSVNRVIDSASDMAEGVKKSFSERGANCENSENNDTEI